MRFNRSVASVGLIVAMGSFFLQPSAPARANTSAEAVKKATAEQILQETARGLASSPTLRFEFRVEEQHGEKNSLFAGQGVTSEMEGDRRRIRLEGSTSDPQDPTFETKPLVVTDDGTLVAVVDHRKQTQWSSPLYRAGGILFQVWTGKFMNSLAAPTVLPALIGLGPTVLEDSRVGDVDCHVLQMPIPGGVQGTVFVGKKDGLPRRALLEAQGFRSQTDLSDWRLESKSLPASEFSVATSEGFEIKEFTLGGPAPGEPAPDFELRAVDGSTITLAELKGKVVVLDFWATWCIPCRASMTGVQELYEELGDRPFAVVSATYMEQGDPAALVEELGVTYPWYNGDTIAEPYGVDQSGLPTMFLIGPDGRVLDYFYGFTGEESEARLRSAVEAALDSI